MNQHRLDNKIKKEVQIAILRKKGLRFLEIRAFVAGLARIYEEKSEGLVQDQWCFFEVRERMVSNWSSAPRITACIPRICWSIKAF